MSGLLFLLFWLWPSVQTAVQPPILLNALYLPCIYAINYKLMGSGKKAVLLATAYDNNDWTMRELAAYYRTIVKYLNWTDAGMVLAGGCGSRSDIERSDFGQQEYRLGKSL